MLRGFCTFRKEYAVSFLLLFAVGAIWFWLFNTNYFFRPDALDYAQMGRELGDGNGFSTLKIFPRHIRFFQEKGYLEKENWPNLYRYPMPTILNAFFYKITNDIVKGAVLQSGMFFLLSVPLLLILATRLTNLKVGIISTIFYAVDPVIFTGSYEAMTEPMAVFLLLCLFLMAFSQKLSRWKCVAMGIICGLSYLNRNQFIFLVPLTALYMWFNTEKRMKVGGLVLLLVGFLLAVGPWLVRNMVVAGDPVFSFSTSRCLVFGSYPVHSDLSLQLDTPVGNLTILKEHGPAIAKKVLKNLSAGARLSFWSMVFSPKGSILLFFLFTSIIYRRNSTNHRYDSFRNAVFFLVVGNFLTVSLAFHSMRFYTPLMPLIYVVGVREILTLGGLRLRYSRGLKQSVFYGMLLLGFIRLYHVTEQVKVCQPPLTANRIASFQVIKEVVDKDTIVASNMPTTIAVYAGCHVLKLPEFPTDLLEINDSYLQIDYVLITKDVLESAYKPYASYSEFIESDEFVKRFRYSQELPCGAVLFKRL